MDGAVNGCANCLVPAGTFGETPRARRALSCARASIFCLYVTVCVASCGVISSFLVGNVVQIENRVLKYQHLETPSVVVCPFEAHGTLVRDPDAKYDIVAVKHSTDGLKETLSRRSVWCRFGNRECMCLDLQGHTLSEATSRTPDAPAERVEIHTTLEEPGSKTFKIGFYDSIDPVPDWSYVEQDTASFGHFKLESWLVTDTTARNLHALADVAPAELQRRHYYSYHFSRVGHDVRGPQDTMPTKGHHTLLTYEFKNFFVQEYYSYLQPWSPFAFVSVGIMLLAVVNYLNIFNILFPVHGHNGIVKRNVSPFLTSLCCRRIGSEHHATFSNGKSEFSKSAKCRPFAKEKPARGEPSCETETLTRNTDLVEGPKEV